MLKPFRDGMSAGLPDVLGALLLTVPSNVGCRHKMSVSLAMLETRSQSWAGQEARQQQQASAPVTWAPSAEPLPLLGQCRERQR